MATLLALGPVLRMVYGFLGSPDVVTNMSLLNRTFRSFEPNVRIMYALGLAPVPPVFMGGNDYTSVPSEALAGAIVELLHHRRKVIITQLGEESHVRDPCDGVYTDSYKVSAFLLPGTSLRFLVYHAGHHGGGPWGHADDQLVLDHDGRLVLIGGLAEMEWEGPFSQIFKDLGCSRFINRAAFGQLVRPALVGSPLLRLSDGQLLYLLIHSGPPLDLRRYLRLDVRFYEYKFRQRSHYISTTCHEKDYDQPLLEPVVTISLQSHLKFPGNENRPSGFRRLVQDAGGFYRVLSSLRAME